MLKKLLLVSTALAVFGAVSCAETEFSGKSANKVNGDDAKKRKPMGPEDDNGDGGGNGGGDGNPGDKPVAERIPGVETKDILTTDGSKAVQPCSGTQTTSARANPYFAGMSGGTIEYPGQDTDKFETEQPMLAKFDHERCLTAGGKLFFEVTGAVGHGGSSSPGNADGNTSQIVTHSKGALNGKSNITAPIASFIGVFLGDSVPASAPSAMNFSSQSQRDQASLSPQLGQIFFIGDGKNSKGEIQKIIVPNGAKRLYTAVMDTFEWSDNKGSVTGSISWSP